MILGITGSFGGGKSAVAELFATAKWRKFDADAFCRKLYDDADSDFAGELERLWGRRVFSETGALDRAAVAKIVFADPVQLERLTALIYPRLDRAMDFAANAWRTAGENAVFEVPLLFEHHCENRFDAVLTVWAAPDIRRDRLRDRRGFDDAEIKRRETRQLDPDKKLELADFALINNGSFAELQIQFRALLAQLEQNSSSVGCR